MTKIRSAIILCAIPFFSFLLGPFSFPDTPDEDVSYVSQCNLKNNTFKAGEKLVYKLYYNWKFVWVPAGEAVFDISEDSTHYEIQVTGKTYPSYDGFFQVNDYFYSRIDKESLYPVNFVRDIEEGKYRLYDSISFNQNTHEAITYHGRTKEKAKEKAFYLGECMQDLLSVLYYFRNLDFEEMKKGDVIPVKIFFDKEVFPINIKFQGKKANKKIKNLGRYNTIKITPEMVAGKVFDENSKMNIWIGDDKNKIPVLIESPVKIGSVKAVLKSYSGLKYDLESKQSASK